ncbi:MAG TPA: glucose-1-phosphate adenylyltransferase subunit GlgD [Clostridia bacterium]|nr:glucose-1-phosphate adenylyltransferase subunit GlgD [Clostridia bacterium]
MNAFCILFSDSFEEDTVSVLTKKRTLGSLPFGGRYRLIDFMLSNLVHASVPEVAVVARNHYSSLADHLGSGKDWDLSRKNGGIKLLTPFMNESGYHYQNRFEALSGFNTYLTRLLPEYAIVADANLVCTVDLRDLLKQHMESGADLTVVCSEGRPRQGDTEVSVGEDGIIYDARCHTGSRDSNAILLRKIFIMKKSVLLDLVDQGTTYGWSDLSRDFIAKKFSSHRLYAYRYQGYFAAIRTLQDYYVTSMDLLNAGVRRELLGSETHILTKIKDTVPTMYGDYGQIANSLVADGCRIEGTVENSILFRDVRIGRDVVVRNSIVMQGCILEGEATLSNTILDKDVRVTKGHSLSGGESYPFVVEKSSVV